MNGKKPLSRGSRFFVVLVMLSVAANSTQAVVLCMGSDGHVAIELAGHQHCECSPGSEEAAHDANAFAAEQEACCEPCVDIPLSSAISDGPVVQKAPKINTQGATVALSIPDMADHGLEALAAVGAYPAFISYHHPLSTIILVV